MDDSKPKAPKNNNSNNNKKKNKGGSPTPTPTPAPAASPLRFPLALTLDKPLAEGVKYWDSHTHLDYTLRAWNQKEALEKGEEKFSSSQLSHFQERFFPPAFEGAIHVCCFQDQFEDVETILSHPFVFGAFGCHPHEARLYTDLQELNIAKRMAHPKTVAWGEMGLDFHYNNSQHEVQRTVFGRQLQKAREFDKPIIIHSREADNDTFTLLKEKVDPKQNIHMHCWGSPDKEFAEKLMKEFPNLYFGFTGAITFKSAESTREVVEIVPIERILLETDCPYMAPGKYRGATAHPGHIPIVAQQVSNIKKIEVEKVLEITRENTKRMYHLDQFLK